MNNKGFTLVELLAVIVLIAVLSVVAVSTYRGINESSKQKTLEAKIQQIKTSAEKWARENNITTKTSLSVNTLVVEGYLTADSVGTDGLAYIKNPVNDENMICNVVEITFEKGQMKTVFNGNVYNCKLAAQSLVDSNIDIKIIDSDGNNLTGSSSGSIAKWTNKDIVVIVNSNSYDAKASSISYDIEGSTITKNKSSLSKYTGTSYVTNPDDYYNVYYIKAELLLNTKLVVTYDIPGEGTKSRAYTIRFDKEEATAVLTDNTDWLTVNQAVTVVVDDGKGSGQKNIYLSRNENSYDATNPIPITGKKRLENLEVGKYYIWTEDNAGNISHTYKLSFEVNNVDKEVPGCEIIFNGTAGAHGWYISNVTPVVQNTPEASVSGVNIGGSLSTTPSYSAFARYQTKNQVTMTPVTTETTTAGINYYCYVKSLAGQTNNATRNLKIDKTPPTVTVHVNNAGVYTQQKNVRVTITDSLSGVNRKSHVKLGLSSSAGSPPGAWLDLEVSGIDKNNETFNVFPSAFEYTGEYYVWIDVSEVTDYAGNHTSEPYVISGVAKFDNTPPSCEVTSISNQCTTGGVSCVVICDDAHSGVFSCPGVQTGLTSTTRFVASDQAGNSSSCNITISSTTQYRKATCDYGKRCEAAGCASWSDYDCNCQSCVSCPPGCNESHGECHDERGVACTTTTYDCNCQTCYSCDYYNRSIADCGCASWNDWQGWQNTAITGCNSPYCKSESRVVYHSGGTCNAGNYSGGAATCNSSFINGPSIERPPKMCQ